MGTEKSKKFSQSKYLKIAIIAVGAVLVALISFSFGMSVGLHKAKFSYKWGENYERNFVGPPPPHSGPRGFFHDFESREFRNAHGIAGTIISVTGNNILVKDRDGKENTVTVTEKTIIKKRREDIKIGDLKRDNQIVVVGSPGDNGMVSADIIRVFE